MTRKEIVAALLGYGLNPVTLKRARLDWLVSTLEWFKKKGKLK